MTEAAHRQQLSALGKRRFLKCRCDASAVQRQVDSVCFVTSQISFGLQRASRCGTLEWALRRPAPGGSTGGLGP